MMPDGKLFVGKLVKNWIVGGGDKDKRGSCVQLK